MTETQRRSMNTALRTSDLSPEELAFIRAGTPQPKVVEPVIESKIPPISIVEKETDPFESETASIVNPESIERGRANKPRIAREREPEPMASELRTNMSIRVPTKIPDGLLRAATDRKLKRIKPCTQQEIATEAIAEWLKRRGYI